MTDWSPPSLTIIVKHRIDMKDIKLTDLEDKFCLVFASGPAPSGAMPRNALLLCLREAAHVTPSLRKRT